MNPDEIKRFIEVTFDMIVAVQRNNPDGWAFYFREVRKGPNSTRIARAIQKSSGSPTLFKLVVTSRLNSNEAAEILNPNEGQVRELFTRELRLWKEHFE